MCKQDRGGQIDSNIDSINTNANIASIGSILRDDRIDALFLSSKLAAFIG